VSPTEQEEARLRSLLRAAVPEPPAIDPEPATKTRRRRGTAVAILAVAAAVVAVTVVPPLLDPAPEGATGPSADTAPTPTGPLLTGRSVDPFRTSCPRELPFPARAVTDLPDLRKVRAVRLCADPAGPTDDPMDALVGDGVKDFADRIGTIGAPDVDRCAALDYVPTRTSLVLTRDDGSQVAVPTDFCTDLRPDPGTEFTVTRRDVLAVSASEVTAAFLAALDAQRRAFSYPLVDISLPRLGCDSRTTQAPVRPTDGVFEGPVLCTGPGGRPVRVPTAGKEVLEEALAATPEPATTEGVGGYDDEMPYLLYRTSRYDVVRLSPTDEGLLLDPWQVGFGLGRSTVVPLDVSDVTDP
jgi:hypothetical protein